MKDYKSFDLLYDLYFVRTGGSKEELKAANIIASKAKELGADEVHLEEFDVDGYEIKKASLRFDNPSIEVECAGVGQSGSTPNEGLTGEFIYVTSLADARLVNVEDKICLVHSKLCNYALYKLLVEKKAKALILCTGSVYKDAEDVDLDPYMYRERHYKNGKIPAVCIRMKDAEEILKVMPKTASIVMIEDELTNKSHNVVATIKGSKYPDEIVCFTAHYDSVAFSKGAYDNATGSTGIMQILSYFSENKPQRTLKFIWCGSEEMGLLGSKAYVRDHKDELANYVMNINIDMLGVTIGNDIACATASEDVVSYIKYDSKMEGFALSARQGVYSSDSTPFADNNVPAISFARLSPTGGATIHSHDDVMDHLSEDNYYASCRYIYSFAEKLVNCVLFPMEKKMPDNMKLELDYYLGRKERPE